MAAYWMSHVKVTDEEAFARYAALAGKVIAAYGGEILVRGGAYEQLEGPERPRNLLIKFPSLQAAHDCYHCDAYQDALRHAHGASERELVIVEAAS